jgi:hypothetical protein
MTLHDIFNLDLAKLGKAESPLFNFLFDLNFSSIEPVAFEKLVLDIFIALGCRGELTPQTGDDGIDIRLKDVLDKTAVVQCKRYNDQPITPSGVREFLGALLLEKADYSFYITTSTFSENASKYCDKAQLRLIDREAFIGLILHALKQYFIENELSNLSDIIERLRAIESAFEKKEVKFASEQIQFLRRKQQLNNHAKFQKE